MVLGTWLDRGVMRRCFQLRQRILNLSRTEINLAFVAGHATWSPIYIPRLQNLSLSLSLSLSLITFALIFNSSQWTTHNSRQLDSYGHITTTKKIGEHTANKTTCTALMKLVYLPHSKLLNFAWTSRSSHHTDTHVYVVGRRILRCFSFSRTHTYLHTHTYM